MDRRMFRGKRLDNGEWIAGKIVTNKPGTRIFTDDNPHECSRDHYIEIDDYYPVDPDSTGQCTGLLAAKSYRGASEDDRTIFEGDRIRLVFRDGDIEEYVVCWNKKRLRFVLEEIGSGIQWGFDDTSDYEIIGTEFDAEGAGSDE